MIAYTGLGLLLCLYVSWKTNSEHPKPLPSKLPVTLKQVMLLQLSLLTAKFIHTKERPASFQSYGSSHKVSGLPQRSVLWLEIDKDVVNLLYGH